MKTKEAIERVKSRFDKWALDEKDLAALQALGLVDTESEDEKIRKDIRLVVESFATRYFKENGKMPDWYDRIVAWLEKQKPEEYPKAVIENAISFLHERNDGMPIEEAREIVNAVVSVLNPKHWIREKPAEWSEEDKKTIDSTIFWLNNALGNAIDRSFPNKELSLKTTIDRLKSLRPQPKQDVSPSLSEKEIICLKRALDHLRKEHNRYSGEDFTNEIAVLEWLITHPVLAQQPHWKPSEEQMCELNWASKLSPVLESLYNDLKQL